MSSRPNTIRILFVTQDTPPTFIYQTFADKTVPPGESISSYQELFKAGVPSELHVFPNGGHGAAWAKAIPCSTSGRACSKAGSAPRACSGTAGVTWPAIARP